MNCGNTSLSGLSSVIPGLETESLEFNTTVRYECLTGYNRSRGDYNRTCLATGSWSGQALECTGKYFVAEFNDSMHTHVLYQWRHRVGEKLHYVLSGAVEFRSVRRQQEINRVRLRVKFGTLG